MFISQEGWPAQLLKLYKCQKQCLRGTAANACRSFFKDFWLARPFSRPCCWQPFSRPWGALTFASYTSHLSSRSYPFSRTSGRPPFSRSWKHHHLQSCQTFSSRHMPQQRWCSWSAHGACSPGWGKSPTLSDGFH